MSSDDSTPPFKSLYPSLERPDFKPNVPGFLLEGASEQDRYIIEQLSLVNQYAQWAVNTEMSTHAQVLKTNGRLMRAEKELLDTREELDAINKRSKLLEPIIKPIAGFLTLWDYRVFRWGVYILLFFLITYALPYYLSHPLSLSGLWTLLTGT